MTWTAPSLPYGNAGGAGMVFADPLHGWTHGPGGLWATSDGGAGWECQPIIGPVPGSAGC